MDHPKKDKADFLQEMHQSPLHASSHSYDTQVQHLKDPLGVNMFFLCVCIILAVSSTEVTKVQIAVCFSNVYYEKLSQNPFSFLELTVYLDKAADSCYMTFMAFPSVLHWL